MKLYFVRHGEASQIAESDALRPLTPKGAARIERAAQVLKGLQCNPDPIFSSPRLRARQTAEIMAVALGKQVEIREECNFDFSLTKVDKLTTGLDDGAEVMFVGHNPSMSAVVQALTGAAVQLKPGAVACARSDQPIIPGALLRWLITPRLFDLLGD